MGLVGAGIGTFFAAGNAADVYGHYIQEATVSQDICKGTCTGTK
jgi:hypothetical protein